MNGLVSLVRRGNSAYRYADAQLSSSAYETLPRLYKSGDRFESLPLTQYRQGTYVQHSQETRCERLYAGNCSSAG